MAAWQRLPAGAACAGQGAPCPPVPAAQDQPLRGSVRPVLRCVLFSCEGAGCCREVGTVSQRREGLCSSLHLLFFSPTPPTLPSRSSPGQAVSRTSDKPSAQTEHVSMEGKTDIYMCFRTVRLALKRCLRAVRCWEPWRTLCSVPARRAVTGQTGWERLALAPATAATACLVYNGSKQ